MIDPSPPHDDPPADRLLPIVIGAHLRAERVHRPLGYRLRERIESWLDAQPPEFFSSSSSFGGGGSTSGGPTSGGFRGLTPIVLTDLWYLNNDDLHGQPVIAIGEPEVNAASAYLAARLPAAFVVEDTLRVQLDPEFIDLRACVWGIPGNEAAAIAAVDALIERYLDEFLRAVHEAM